MPTSKGLFRASNYNGASIGIAVVVRQGVVHLGKQIVAQRIQRLGTVECDHAHFATRLGENVRVILVT